MGYRLGSSRGVEAWNSVEDALVILGPPRSGKGLPLVIPMILDATGPVITTSTRPDNLAATLGKRPGPVAMFDPQGLAPAMPEITELVYRKQIRPVIQCGAVAMDRNFER